MCWLCGGKLEQTNIGYASNFHLVSDIHLEGSTLLSNGSLRIVYEFMNFETTRKCRLGELGLVDRDFDGVLLGGKRGLNELEKPQLKFTVSLTPILQFGNLKHSIG